MRDVIRIDPAGAMHYTILMNHNTLMRSEGTVHYWVQKGNGECIVFTHGATMDHGLFVHQLDHFTGAGYTVISWDVPFHGLSRPWQSFSLARAAEVLGEILDAEQISAAHLVGQSMGGYICQIAALEHPDRVLSLSPVDASPLDISYYSALDKWLLGITPPLLKLYPYSYLIKTIARQIACREEARAYALETLKGLPKKDIGKIMAAVYQGIMAYSHRRCRINCPLHIFYGEKDTSGKVIAYSKRWAAETGAGVSVIPEAAHNANMDNPGAFNRALQDFLARQGT